ncbi:MAG: hypothetical protein PGN34_20775 [Methylobacterium frigidaeris]
MRALHVAALLVLATLGAVAAESRFGRTSYRLAGTDYAVPHRYEFSRNFRLPWLDAIPGLGREPEESLALLLPAAEVAEGLPGYSRFGRGYVGPIEADLVVEVVGDRDRRHFARLHDRQWGHFDARLAEGATWHPDPAGGERLVFSVGADGRGSFYLSPTRETARRADRTPPYCLARGDREGRETYDCSYTIHRDGLTFDFSLRQESVAAADRVPDYVRTRLAGWRR